jgi:hypothetical protein
MEKTSELPDEDEDDVNDLADQGIRRSAPTLQECIEHQKERKAKAALEATAVDIAARYLKEALIVRAAELLSPPWAAGCPSRSANRWP